MTRLALVFFTLACRPAAEEPAPASLDTDGDGILDVHEGDGDVDGDGTANFRDLDSDGDGVPDGDEAGDEDPLSFPVDTDRDRLPDFLDLDSDGNGWEDADEAWDDDGRLRDADADVLADFHDLDNDGDGVLDTDESRPNARFDTDGDGTPDLFDLDSDDDGIPDAIEGACGYAGPCDTDDDGDPDLRDQDSDGDRFWDADEAGDPSARIWPASTDGDDLPDYRDPDSDGDGILDADEAAFGTDPRLRDSDSDGFADGLEVDLGYDPADPESRYRGVFVEAPARRETERGLAFDLQLSRVDVGVVGMARGADPIVLDGVLEAGLTDLAVGYGVVGTYNRPDIVGEYNDPFWAWVAEPERPVVPLVVVAPVDRDVRRVRDAALSLKVETDLWAYGIISTAIPEALRQAAGGAGFDLRCDRVFDAIEDLPPAERNPSDPFGGTAPTWSELDGREGSGAALGFRDRSVRILLNVTDGSWAIPDVDPPSWVLPDHPGFRYELSRYSVEEVGGCPSPPSAEEIRDTLDGHHTFIVHVGWPTSNPLYSYEVTPARNRPIVSGTRSTWDPDGDGTREPYTINASVVVTAPAVRRALIDAVRDNLKDILQDIARKTAIATVKPIVLEDPHGFITGFDPPERPEARIGDQDVPFDLLLRGAVAPVEGDKGYFVEVGVLADEWQVAREEVLVVVPGWGRP